MPLMRTVTIAAALTMLAGGVATPAQAAPNIGAPTIGRPHLSLGQMVRLHDCRPIVTTPDPRRAVRGWLRDNLATPRHDLVYVRSHGQALFGRYRTTHYCYR